MPAQPKLPHQQHYLQSSINVNRRYKEKIYFCTAEDDDDGDDELFLWYG